MGLFRRGPVKSGNYTYFAKAMTPTEVDMGAEVEPHGQLPVCARSPGLFKTPGDMVPSSSHISPGTQGHGEVLGG